MTTKEIVQALRLCGKIDSNCRECKLWGDDRCVEHLAGAAADIIERLTAESADLRKEIEWKDKIQTLYHQKIANFEAERDALQEKQRWIPVTERIQARISSLLRLPSMTRGSEVTKMAELKPCPFCGGEAAFLGTTCTIKCKQCGGAFIATNPVMTRMETAAAWNRRVNDD